MILLGGSSDGASKVAAGIMLVAMVGAAVFTRLRLKVKGADPLPPVFHSLVADVLFWSIAFGIYGYLVGLLIFPEPSIARRMTGFFVLMGAFSTIRQRVWPARSAWYDAAAAAAAVLLSIPLGLMIERVF